MAFSPMVLWLLIGLMAPHGTLTKPQGRIGKVLFSIVRFPNGNCNGIDLGSPKSGTCYTSSECSKIGGSVIGRCASGFGVCCFVSTSRSGSVVTKNNTFILAPKDDLIFSRRTKTIDYTIQKNSPDVCYFRLDFDTFDIMGPSTTNERSVDVGHCDQDSLTISTNSQTGSVPTICGLNTGAHMYIDVSNQLNDSAFLTFTIGTANERIVKRDWEIKVMQVPCGSSEKPPSGCLQYYTGLSGRLMSFNFLKSSSNHLRGQDQSICIKRHDNYCCVKYTVCDEYEDSFSFDDVLVVERSGRVGNECNEEFVIIPGSSAMSSNNAHNLNSKYCGPFLNPSGIDTTNNLPVYDCTPPFTVHFHTSAAGRIGSDVERTLRQNGRGICLDFVHMPCTVL